MANQRDDGGPKLPVNRTPPISANVTALEAQVTRQSPGSAPGCPLESHYHDPQDEYGQEHTRPAPTPPAASAMRVPQRLLLPAPLLNKIKGEPVRRRRTRGTKYTRGTRGPRLPRPVSSQCPPCCSHAGFSLVFRSGGSSAPDS